MTTMISTPAAASGINRHRIVYLEAVHCELPSFGFDCDVISHQKTVPSQVAERIKDATIVIATVCPVTKEDLEQAPNIQLLIILATGMGWVDRPYCAKRGITVCNCPQSNVEALGEHFLALYFASRRRLLDIHNVTTMTNEWIEDSSVLKNWPQGPPLSCAKETLGIIGHGFLGKRFENLARAVGFGKIIISERKGIDQAREGRVTFTELIKTASTVVVCCPLEPDTINLIAEPEIELMRREILIINMARGGIINETALAKALKTGRIYGAATDVLQTEPGGPGTSPLLPDISKGEKPIPNLIVSAHVAWYSQKTIETLKKLLKDGTDSFVFGKLADGEKVKNCVAVYQGKIWK